MSRKYFGTDGVRGRVGQSPITPDFVMKLGYAANRCSSRASNDPWHPSGGAHRQDTRISCYMLEAALEAGFPQPASTSRWSGPCRLRRSPT